MINLAHIARLGLGILLLSVSVASFAKKDTYDFSATGTGSDLWVSRSGVVVGQLKGTGTLLGSYTGILVTDFKKNEKNFGGYGYLRAANGNKLFFEHKGKIDTTHYPFELKGTLDVIGGTGAFEDASGQIKLNGFNFGEGISEFSLDGRIRFDD